jgi:hypothetical protein
MTDASFNQNCRSKLFQLYQDPDRRGGRVAKRPSSKQLAYLKRLGYTGVEPTTSKQASVAIDAMLESKDSKVAERAVVQQRRAEEKREKQARKDRLQAIKEEIRFMVRENRAYGGEIRRFHDCRHGG